MSENMSVPTQPQPQPVNPDDDQEYIKWREERNSKQEHDTADADPRSNPAHDTRDSDIQAAVDRALAERDRQHAAEVTKLQAQVPQLVVPMNGGGPGNDNHRVSWNLAEQEAASRGEDLPHWHDE